jgi:hypothetical protein
MAVERLTDLTLDELKDWIRGEIDRRLQALGKPLDSRSVQAINESIRRNRWTPPPGVPSNRELIRADRDAD